MLVTTLNKTIPQLRNLTVSVFYTRSYNYSIVLIRDYMFNVRVDDKQPRRFKEEFQSLAC